MGADKALLEIGGVSLGQRSVNALLGAGIREVMLVGASDEHAAHLDGIVVADRWADAGPVGGLLSALNAAESVDATAVVCLACDLPQVAVSDVERLIREAEWSPGSSEAVPTVVTVDGQLAFPNGLWPVDGRRRWEQRFLGGATSFHALFGVWEQPRRVVGGAGFGDADRPEDLIGFL